MKGDWSQMRVYEQSVHVHTVVECTVSLSGTQLHGSQDNLFLFHIMSATFCVLQFLLYIVITADLQANSKQSYLEFSLAKLDTCMFCIVSEVNYFSHIQ